MGGVIISPNLKHTKVQINPDGDEVVPFTKRVKKKKEAEYTPTPEEIAGQAVLPVDPVPVPAEAKGKDNPLAAAIKAQVQGVVKKQIESVMKEIDIAGMVKEAIEEAFK